jgi:hypothetical protein
MCSRMLRSVLRLAILSTLVVGLLGEGESTTEQTVSNEIDANGTTTSVNIGPTTSSSNDSQVDSSLPSSPSPTDGGTSGPVSHSSVLSVLLLLLAAVHFVRRAL